MTRNFEWRIKRTEHKRGQRTVVRFVVERGYYRKLERWSPLSPERRWSVVAKTVHKTLAAAMKEAAACKARLVAAHAATSAAVPAP